MKDKFNIIYISLLFSFSLFAQNDLDSLRVNVSAKWGKKPFEFETSYISKNNDTLQITQFKFYLSDFEVMFEDKTKIASKTYRLVDFEKLNSTFFSICKNNKRRIIGVKFSIGVDSLASVSGALGGALDAANGMYWAWQSGYINMKIEGTSTSCTTRKNIFHFHIGGYLLPYYALRSVEIPIDNIQNQLTLTVDLEKYFAEIDLKKLNSVMIPGSKAMILANLCTKMFTVE